MPKAAMDQDHGMMARKRQVWLAGKIIAVEPEPITKSMNNSSDDDFRFGVAGLHSSHVGGSLLLRKFIRHLVGSHRKVEGQIRNVFEPVSVNHNSQHVGCIRET